MGFFSNCSAGPGAVPTAVTPVSGRISHLLPTGMGLLGKYIFWSCSIGKVRCCKFFGHIRLSRFGVKHFRSYSNKFSVILIWLCKLAPYKVQNSTFNFFRSFIVFSVLRSFFWSSGFLFIWFSGFCLLDQRTSRLPSVSENWYFSTRDSTRSVKLWLKLSSSYFHKYLVTFD